MRKSIFTFIIFLSILSVQAQWNDNETNLTTFDNVGIGISNPSSKIHINSSGSTAIRVTRAGSNIFGY